MKIALYQFTPLRGDIAGNLEKIERTIHPYTDIDLWILPELATTGYLFESRETLLSLAESFPGGRTGKWLGSLSRNQNTAIVIGVAEKAGNRLLNSAVVYSAGEQVSVYRKIHLFDNEKRLFDAGAQPPPVVEIGGVHVGVMICFDWIFPELTRSLALSGAQLIAHPSNLVLPYCPDAMITRSIENRIFTATANRTGRENTQDGRVLNFIIQIIDAFFI